MRERGNQIHPNQKKKKKNSSNKNACRPENSGERVNKYGLSTGYIITVWVGAGNLDGPEGGDIYPRRNGYNRAVGCLLSLVSSICGSVTSGSHHLREMGRACREDPRICLTLYKQARREDHEKKTTAVSLIGSHAFRHGSHNMHFEALCVLRGLLLFSSPPDPTPRRIGR